MSTEREVLTGSPEGVALAMLRGLANILPAGDSYRAQIEQTISEAAPALQDDSWFAAGAREHESEIRRALNI